MVESVRNRLAGMQARLQAKDGTHAGAERLEQQPRKRQILVRARQATRVAVSEEATRVESASGEARTTPNAISNNSIYSFLMKPVTATGGHSRTVRRSKKTPLQAKAVRCTERGITLPLTVKVVWIMLRRQSRKKQFGVRTSVRSVCKYGAQTVTICGLDI